MGGQTQHQTSSCTRSSSASVDAEDGEGEGESWKAALAIAGLANDSTEEDAILENLITGQTQHQTSSCARSSSASSEGTYQEILQDKAFEAAVSRSAAPEAMPASGY